MAKSLLSQLENEILPSDKTYSALVIFKNIQGNYYLRIIIPFFT
jgi:hypothetical protein